MKPILSLCLCLVAFKAGAQEQHPWKPCPEEFPVEAIKLSPLPQGWTGVRPTRLLLTSIDAMVGPPQPAVAIGEERKVRNGYQVVFDTSSSTPNEKWLACRYGDLSLAERLPDDTESCTVTHYRRPAYNDEDIQVSCRLKSKTAPAAPTARQGVKHR